MSYEAPYELPAIPRQHTLIGAGGFLQSQDFVSGSAGWQITGDGTVEFSSGTFRADVTAANIRTAASGTRIEMLSGAANIMTLHTANSVSSYPGQVTVNEGTDGTHGDHSNFQLLAPAMTGSTRPGITIQHFDDGDSRIYIGTDDSDPQIVLQDLGGTDELRFKGLVRYEDNGSVSAPTVNFLSNDADSGFFYSAATQIGLASDGHNAMISASGTGSSGSAAGTIATAAFDTNSTSGYQAVYRNNTYGTLARYTSNRADKDNIQSFSNSGAIIDALQPVTFVTKARDGESTADKAWREADIQHGFIAEDVADVADGKFASYDNVDGSLVPNGWRQPDMISLIVAELKSIRQRLVALES
jgi:hypothetical protein